MHENFAEEPSGPTDPIRKTKSLKKAAKSPAPPLSST